MSESEDFSVSVAGGGAKTITIVRRSISGGSAGEPKPSLLRTVSETCDTRHISAGKARILVVLIALVNFTTAMTFSLIAPFFPLEAEEKKGLTVLQVGIIFSEFELINGVFTLIFGYFVKQIGPTFLYCAGLFTASACAFMFASLQWCPASSFFALSLTVRLFEALGFSAAQLASMTILSSLFPDTVSTVLGALEAFTGLGFMAGPAIGGVLYEFGGFYLPFVVAGSLLLFAFTFSFCVLPKSIENRPFDKTLFQKFIRLPDLFPCFIVIVCDAMIIVYLDPILAKYIGEVELSISGNEALIGLIFIIISTAYALTGPLWGWLSDKTGMAIYFSLFGNTLDIIGNLLVGPFPQDFIQPSLLCTSLALACLGVGIGAGLIPIFNILASAAKRAGMPDGVQTFGLISGFFGFSFSCGAFGGPLISGWLVDLLGFRKATAWMTILPGTAVVSLLCYLIYDKRRTRSGEEDEDGLMNEETQTIDDIVNRVSSYGTISV